MESSIVLTKNLQISDLRYLKLLKRTVCVSTFMWKCFANFPTIAAASAMTNRLRVLFIVETTRLFFGAMKYGKQPLGGNRMINYIAILFIPRS